MGGRSAGGTGRGPGGDVDMAPDRGGVSRYGASRLDVGLSVLHQEARDVDVALVGIGLLREVADDVNVARESGDVGVLHEVAGHIGPPLSDKPPLQFVPCNGLVRARVVHCASGFSVRVFHLVLHTNVAQPLSVPFFTCLAFLSCDRKSLPQERRSEAKALSMPRGTLFMPLQPIVSRYLS